MQDLKTKFTHIDSKWVEMVLDEMSLQGDDRDREAQFVVRFTGRAIEGLQPKTTRLPETSTHKKFSRFFAQCAFCEADVYRKTE